VRFNDSLPVAAWVLCMAASPVVFAQSVPFTISGTIDAPVCTPALLGGSQWSGNTLALPDVKVSELASAGATAHPIPLTFQLTNCQVTQSNMWVYFESAQVDSEGRIIPTTGAAIDRVRFEILDGNTSTRVHASVSGSSTGNIGAPNANQGTGVTFTGTGVNRTASKTYTFQYYTTQALLASHAGTSLSAGATYTVMYY